MKRALRAMAALGGVIILIAAAAFGAAQSPAAKRFFRTGIVQEAFRP